MLETAQNFKITSISLGNLYVGDSQSRAGCCQGALQLLFGPIQGETSKGSA